MKLLHFPASSDKTRSTQGKLRSNPVVQGPAAAISLASGCALLNDEKKGADIAVSPIHVGVTTRCNSP